jgi:hypothetical protein
MDREFTTYHGDKVTLTKFKYYLGNIELKSKDGGAWRSSQKYYLIDINDETSSEFTISLPDAPAGEYVQLSFAIGVDSISNHSGVQEGALDPDHGMFWMWETGYVFFKVEGYYTSTQGQSGAMVYHIGRDNCYKKVHLNLPKGLQIIPGGTCRLNVGADVRKVFGGHKDAAINLTASHGARSISVMGGEKAPKVANNFVQIFSILD